MQDGDTWVLRTRCGTEEREKKLQGYCADVGDVEVVCDLLFSAWKKRRSWRDASGWYDGISCQHLQVLTTQLLQKHREWHCCVKRPTMYLASMDIKTAFGVARPQHIAKNMGDQDVQGWITAALQREIAGLEGQATFGNVESTFSFARCSRQGSVEAPRLWLKNGHADLGECRGSDCGGGEVGPGAETRKSEVDKHIGS